MSGALDAGVAAPARRERRICLAQVAEGEGESLLLRVTDGFYTVSGMDGAQVAQGVVEDPDDHVSNGTPLKVSKKLEQRITTLRPLREL